MADKKVTKREWFEVIIGIVNNSEYADKEGAVKMLTHEIELLDKKSGKSKETKAHVAIMATIKEVLADMGKPVTITEMLTDTRLANYEEESKDGVKVIAMTNQKLSFMVKKLVDAGEVIRTEEKKKAYFSLPAEDEEEEEYMDDKDAEELLQATENWEDENGTENE